MAYTQIEISCGGLSVTLGTELQYPDAVDDLCKRTVETFKECIATAKANDVDISDMRLITTDYSDYGDDDEEV